MARLLLVFLTCKIHSFILVTLHELQDMGIKIVIYSTPCLFAAQTALENAMTYLKEHDGKLPTDSIGVKDCTAILDINLKNRDTR